MTTHQVKIMKVALALGLLAAAGSVVAWRTISPGSSPPAARVLTDDEKETYDGIEKQQKDDIKNGRSTSDGA